ncbi:trimeric intracellular cation channel family protein [Deinococcus alpinitundrae]|uniref:trimeric intracellular cation channel family protein n=1 Tax=Deinococcus alpinitundrae TaxID=468913 RepID=UPI001ED8F509|nr:trimeric intracellular cation channel family protein [Deinococcus alpinitundrae]
MSDGSPFPYVDPATIRTGLHYLDLAGIFAFSMSGALAAVRRRFDIFGVLVLGGVTAVGGGSIRDTLTGNTPPLFLKDETYLWVAILGALLAFAFGERLARFERTLSFFDTIGLSLFAASGALLGVQLGLGPLSVTFVGMLSGVGGGVIRDLLAAQVPEVMYRNDQLYATAAALGAITVYFIHPYFPDLETQLLAAAVVVAARWLSRRGWVRLPVRRLPESEQSER